MGHVQYSYNFGFRSSVQKNDHPGGRRHEVWHLEAMSSSLKCFIRFSLSRTFFALADTSWTSSDVSVQDLTLQTSTPEKLKRRYPLRKRKPPQTFYSLTRITRTVYMRLLHQLTFILGFFLFFLSFISKGAFVISRTLCVRSSFVYHVPSRTSLLRLTVQICLLNTWNTSTLLWLSVT